ncbi:unnamed protein product [Brassica napus]|uniref:(rape) hypothetical protein n=1 Tax=Brassica napus TaxID=3708 RepID=A0A816PQA1_BRANA|nr:unnamed protein product [Brassica napus]
MCEYTTTSIISPYVFILCLKDFVLKDRPVLVSKSFAEGNITLEKYVTTVKGLVGLRLLVEAVAIGGAAAYTSLTSAEIVNQLKGRSSRLSKARCNDIFWEAVWPRLLARGWRSEQRKDHRGYTIVFIAIITNLRREEDGSKETGSKPLVQVEDSEPSFLLNGENTESKASDRRQDSKPVVLTEHPKLTPIVWKLSFQRSRGASET